MVMRFNKKALANIVGRVNAEYLFLAGASLRSFGKKQLKTGKEKNGQRIPSKPGESPKIWGNSPLKNLILYELDPYQNSMVAGSALSHSSPNPVPGILEYGGSTLITVQQPYQPKNKRKWGSKHYTGTRPKLKRPTKTSEYYSYFRSKSAWERAKESSGFQGWARANSPPKITQTVHISARPYMQKALNQVTSARYSSYLYSKAVQRANR